MKSYTFNEYISYIIKQNKNSSESNSLIETIFKFVSLFKFKQYQNILYYAIKYKIRNRTVWQCKIMQIMPSANALKLS